MNGTGDITLNVLDVTMAVVVGGLFTTGFHLMMQRSLMRIVLGFVLLGHGTNVLLLVVGGAPGRPPVLREKPVNPAEPADPLPQAMALTSIVITFGLTAFLMALAYRSWRLSGSDEVRDDVEDQRIVPQHTGSGGGGPVDPGDGDEDGRGEAPGGSEPGPQDHGTSPGEHR